MNFTTGLNYIFVYLAIASSTDIKNRDNENSSFITVENQGRSGSNQYIIYGNRLDVKMNGKMKASANSTPGDLNPLRGIKIFTEIIDSTKPIPCNKCPEKQGVAPQSKDLPKENISCKVKKDSIPKRKEAESNEDKEDSCSSSNSSSEEKETKKNGYQEGEEESAHSSESSFEEEAFRDVPMPTHSSSKGSSTKSSIRKEYSRENDEEISSSKKRSTKKPVEKVSDSKKE
ncbi:hypothetical protein H312_02110, partial [Anncaliia algerae PRA339]